jgi:predicted ribosomally synthesized peptide with SipW-like signal peptide
MTDDKIKLTRRKILGSVGAVGAAGAAAGLGTSALFSDEESFTNNTLTAGTLDLKVDWEEHYFGGRDRNGSDEATVVGGDPNPAEVDYYLPALGEPDIDPLALNFETNQDDLWDATAIEAFPDTDDSGSQDDEQITCSDLESVDSALNSDDRTEDSREDPLIQLDDVKPGDFGEVTFSFHLCDNPGYVWMNGELVDWSEGNPMYTEPELSDPDEDGSESDAPTVDDIELLDAVRTRMWYDDNCDNQLETGTVDVMIIVDKSISQESDDQQALRAGLLEFLSGLSSDTNVGLLEFGDGEVDGFQGLDSPSSLNTTGVGTGEGGGNTPLPPALDIAHQELVAEGNNDEQVIVAFTDGGPNYFNKTYSAGSKFDSPGGSGSDSVVSSYSGGGGGQDAQNDTNPRTGGISDSELLETAEIAEAIRDAGTRIITVDVEIPEGSTDDNVDTGEYLRNYIASSQAYAKDVILDDLAAVANDLAAVTMNEDLFFEGSLRKAMDVLSSGNGIPLDGNPGASAFNEFSGLNRDIDDDGDDELPADTFGGATDEDREEFAGGDTTHCVAFEWWVPLGVGNEIQSDTAEFNLGFYTEQSRNNDGSGPTEESAD